MPAKAHIAFDKLTVGYGVLAPSVSDYQIMSHSIAYYWSRDGGYGEVLRVSIPLILSTGAWSILLFVDRMFLSWYSPQAIAAAMPAGLAHFSMLCIFIGTAAYVNTFVAQYFGAKNEHRIGEITWQSIYLSLTSLFLIIPAYFFAETFFKVIGHSSELQKLEISYFRLLLYSGVFIVLNSALSSFFSGLGQSLVVMWVNIGITLINIVLDYTMIFGHFGFPALGIKGAAIASDIAVISGTLMFWVIYTRKDNRQRFRTLAAWKFDYSLLRRLIYFGFPNGLRFFIDMSAFTAFLFFIGTLGTQQLAASSIAFNINVLSFLPMVGLMIGVSVLVGQYLGADKPALAERATWSAIHIALAFFGTLAALYLLAPKLFIWPFTIYDSLENLENTIALTIILLRFIAFFGVFDSMFLVFLGALEGAGDTRFIVKASLLMSWLSLVVPCYIYINWFEADLLILWWIITINVFIYCCIFYFRFRHGPWRNIRVIH